MNSLWIWLISIIAGALLGYLTGYFIEIPEFVLVGIGVIIGSSAGITINIHRDKEPIPDFEEPAETGSNEEQADN